MPDSKTFILDDLPTDTDALDFQPYVDTLVDVCKSASTPLTIGVFGGWGSGKTSLMKMVRKGLPKEFTVAWFDAWKYDKEETLWRAFLLSVLSAMQFAKKLSDDEHSKLTTMLYRALDLEKSGGVTIDLAKFFPKLAQGAMQIGLSFLPGGTALSKLVEELQKAGTENISQNAFDAIQRERTKIHIEQVRFLEQFQEQFARLVKDRVAAKNGRLVVFVDDLDRCLPEKAVEVLEAIKLFVDAPGCVFVLGLDQEVIARGVEIRYKDFQQKDGANQINGAKYLEKIIQLPFQIPPVERTDMGEFVNGLSADWPDKECPNIFAEGLGENPRQIKRTVNVFLMLWKLAEKREKKLQGRIKPIRLAKVVAIQTIYPELYSLLKETPRYLRELEEYYRAENQKDEQQRFLDSWKGKPVEELLALSGELERERERRETLSEKEKIAEKSIPKVDLPPALSSFISRQAVRKILTLHPPELPDANFVELTPDELRLYFTLTRRAEAPQAVPADTAHRVFEPQMVCIPEGKFLMGTTSEQAQQVLKESGNDENSQIQLGWEQPQHSVELSEYSIGKYPATNREYQAFVREAKYKSPQGWDGDQYPPEKGDHPVVRVSWDDAQEYCKWLSKKANKTYRLPTEAEWEKAARGDKDARVFPWGDEFDPKKANTDKAGIGDTSPVGQFSPQGDSPYGCVDMAGNIWEWCTDWFNENEYKNRKEVVKDPQGPDNGIGRVLRGGSFINKYRSVRCARRNWDRRNYVNMGFGFRVVVSPAPTVTS